MKLQELIEKGNITRRALRKYVGLGLIGRPRLEHHGPGSCTSHYPDDSLTRIEWIKWFKDDGKTLAEIKQLLPEALVGAEARERLEAQHGRMQRSSNLPPNPDQWLQLTVELMLREAGVSADEISDELISGLTRFGIERDKDGAIKAIRVEEDAQAKTESASNLLRQR